MSDRYWVYGLTDPMLNKVFYVGYTVNPTQRFAAHWAARGDCSSYRIIRYWKRTGLKFGHIIFGDFDTTEEARRLERMLILNLPELVNDLSPQTMISQILYPIGFADELLLEKAMDWMAGGDRGGVVDASPEYVDERYDEFDNLDA